MVFPLWGRESTKGGSEISKTNLTSLFPEEKFTSGKCQSRFLCDLFTDSLKQWKCLCNFGKGSDIVCLSRCLSAFLYFRYVLISVLKGIEWDLVSWTLGQAIETLYMSSSAQCMCCESLQSDQISHSGEIRFGLSPHAQLSLGFICLNLYFILLVNVA